MKNFKLFFLMLLTLGIVSTSCKKTEEEKTEDLVNTILDVKGSIDLNVNGVTYNKLFSSVVYAENDKMVSFWAYDLDSEDSFVVTFGEVPSVGATGTVDFESDNGMTLMIIGSFLDDGGYFAQSGTISRVSTDKYEINVMMANMQQTSTPFALTGSVTVGEHNP